MAFALLLARILPTGQLQVINATGAGSTGIAATPGCGFVSVTPSAQFNPLVIDNATTTYRILVSAPDAATAFAAVRVYYTLQVSPAPSVATFSDVPTSHPFFQFVEALVASGAPKLDPLAAEPVKTAKSKNSGGAEPIIPNVPAITPTSAFNLSYNDYLNGKYDLAVSGFQRFVKDFPGTSLTPNAHYWLGESYYQQKDYARAMQAFEYVSTEFPGNEKVPAALYKLGLAAAEVPADNPSVRRRPSQSHTKPPPTAPRMRPSRPQPPWSRLYCSALHPNVWVKTAGVSASWKPSQTIITKAGTWLPPVSFMECTPSPDGRAARSAPGMT